MRASDIVPIGLAFQQIIGKIDTRDRPSFNRVLCPQPDSLSRTTEDSSGDPLAKLKWIIYAKINFLTLHKSAHSGYVFRMSTGGGSRHYVSADSRPVNRSEHVFDRHDCQEEEVEKIDWNRYRECDQPECRDGFLKHDIRSPSAPLYGRHLDADSTSSFLSCSGLSIRCACHGGRSRCCAD